MKINELCYLDRVSFKGKTIVVTGIDGTFNEVTDEFQDIYDASVLEPIEITDEILLKNNFKRSGNGFSLAGGVYFEDFRLSFPITEELVIVRYVHELLHAIGRYNFEWVKDFTI